MSQKINCIGATDTFYYKMQTADCRPDTKYRLQSGFKMQTENLKSFYVCLTNRFQVAVRLFSNKSQMTSKCGEKKK